MLKQSERYVIEADGNFLVVPPGQFCMWRRWSQSAYDAVKFARRRTARSVAKTVKGRVVIFNRLTGVVRDG